MKDTRNSRIKIAFVLIATAVVVAYIYLVAPTFLSKLDTLRVENKQIEYDLDAIEKMGDDKTEIRNNIADAREQLEAFKARTKIDGTNYDMDISEKADKANVNIDEMNIENLKVFSDRKINGKTLHLQPITISFTGNFDEGVEFIKALEKSGTGLYRIKDFLYSKVSDKKMSWMISMDVYYYEEVKK